MRLPDLSVFGWRSRPRIPRHQRIYAIGDVHGRLDLFARIIRAIEVDSGTRPVEAKRTRVVLIGDVIDRGPDSRDLIRLLMRAQRTSPRIVVLLGNHEATLLASLDGDALAQEHWLATGGRATLDSFGIAPPTAREDPDRFAARLAAGLSEQVVGWLRQLPLSYQCGDYFFCHAGIRPGVRLDRQTPEDLLWIREPFLSCDRTHGRVVVHGHSISPAIEWRANRIGIDTGAYRTGCLSAIGLEAEERWAMATGPAVDASLPDAQIV